MTSFAKKEVVAYSGSAIFRELKNVVERAIILSGDKPEICPKHLTFQQLQYVTNWFRNFL
ncbi:MAG: hypothetical protein R3E08_02765 [Thiotrichaceae bacterium]